MKTHQGQLSFCLRIGIGTTLLIGFNSSLITAHEGHAPLPSKGVTVEGEQLLLSPGAIQAVGLKTVKIGLSDLQRTIRANARVELPWNTQALVTTPVNGRIEEVYVRPGETVEVGQELMRVESLEMATLQLEMLQATSEFGLAERMYERLADLLKKGAIGERQLLDARMTLEQKAVRVGTVKRKLQILGLTSESLNTVLESGKLIPSLLIRSPIQGVITHADVRVGQVVRATDHLSHIVDLSTVWAVGEVLETDMTGIHSGLRVHARFTAFPEKAFSGEIAHVRLKLDDAKRTEAVVVSLKNTDGLLKPGMSGKMDIQAFTVNEAVVCPTAALIENEDRAFVLLQRGDARFQRRAVRIGMRQRNQVEIRDGLFPGDRVVVTGVHLLASRLGPPPAQNRRSIAAANSKSDGHTRKEPNSARERGADQIVTQGKVELPTHAKTFAGARIDGRIARILVQPTQQVRRGDLLAEVDSLELKTAQLDLLQERAKQEWTRKRLERVEQVSVRGAAAEKEIWQLRTELETQRNSVASLTRRLALIGLSDADLQQIEKVDLTAPESASALINTVPVRASSDGLIAEFNVVQGQVVQPYDTLFEIQDLSRVWVKSFVFESDASRIRLGEEGDLTFPAFPDRHLNGSIVRIDPLVVAPLRVLPVWFEVENPDRQLREGMLARVVIHGTTPRLTPAVSRAGAAPSRER